MAEIDFDQLLFIVVGVQLAAELGDRPLAYEIEQRIRRQLAEMPKPDESDEGAGPLTPAVISDVYYLNSEEAQARPVISIGGPGVNALSSQLVNELPTVIAIENTLVVQMDLDMEDARAAVWGMDHVQTVRAVELFVDKGYLARFVEGVWRG